MAHLIIQDLNDDLITIFEQLADKLGASTQRIDLPTKATTINNRHQTLSHTLLSIPKSADDEDLFARTPSTSREINWLP